MSNPTGAALNAANRESLTRLLPSFQQQHMGRPSKYTQDLADEICEGLSFGKTLAAICMAPNMPSRKTIWEWERDNDEFRNRSTHARELGTHALADECISIADSAEIDPQDKRVRIDTRLRLIGKWNAKRYGEKIDIDATHSGKIVIEIGGNAS